LESQDPTVAQRMRPTTKEPAMTERTDKTRHD
jgi:hypothetical protein